MMQDLQASLAKVDAAEVLHDKGLTVESVRALSAESAHQIMVEASTYAVLKLADVANKSQIVHELHGGAQSG